MRKGFAVWVVGVLFAIVLAPLPAMAGQSDSPEPMYGPQNLFGHFSRGWGFMLNGETNPGPAISVARFETATLNLFSSDGPTPHTWLLDLNLDGIPDPGENQSAVFMSSSTPLVFTFVPTAPSGIYQYVCGIHGTQMIGQFFITAPVNVPPTASLTNPDGSPNRWTGGSLKRLTWTMNDPDGTPSNLAVWLNYTSSVGNGPIASPPTLPLGALFYDWNVPLIDATDLRVHIDVADPAGARGSDAKLVPIIDSTAPVIAGTDPSNGASGVSPGAGIIITFSEPVRVPGPGTVGFLPPVGGLTSEWGSGNTVLFVNHTTALQGATLYDVTVSDFSDTSAPGNVMATFSFSFTTANGPPTITITQPTGTSRWTGNTAHNLQWAATDAEEPASALTVWVNYSATGAAPFSPISGLQGVPGDTTTFPWPVPFGNTSGARLNFSAVDSLGANTIRLSSAFVVDSAPPLVSETFPSNGQVNVPLNTNLVITFSEAMNQAATENSDVVALQGPSSWIPFSSVTWDGPSTRLTVDPLPANLVANTMYQLHINGSARDAADPGLVLGLAVVVSFTTGAAPDTTPPVLSDIAATPSTAIVGGSVEISVNVTDDTGVVEPVSVIVTLPDSSTQNLTMTHGTGSRWAASRTWTQDGMHTFVIWASDTSGNWGSGGGSFTTVALDTTPPTIGHTSPGPHAVGTVIHITATVTDAGGVALVRLVYTPVGGVEQNVTMASSGGNTYTFMIPAQTRAGTIPYRIYAVDAAGNDRLSQEYTVTISAPASSDIWLYAGLALLLIIGIAAIALFLTRRKRKGGPEKRDGGQPPSGL